MMENSIMNGCNCGYDEFLLKEAVIDGKLYYVEVSGGIEHYFNEYGCYVIHNSVVSKLLGVSDDLIYELSDGVHYRIDGESFEKALYSFNSKEEFYSVLKMIDECEEFMNEAHKFGIGSGYNIKQCYYIIDNIYRLHEEEYFYELLPSCHQALLEISIELESHDSESDTISLYKEYAAYLLKHVPVLKLHEMKMEFTFS